MSAITILQGCLVLLVLSAIAFQVFESRRTARMYRSIVFLGPLAKRLLPSYLLPCRRACGLTRKSVTCLSVMQFMIHTGQVFQEQHKRFITSSPAFFVRTTQSHYEPSWNPPTLCQCKRRPCPAS